MSADGAGVGALGTQQGSAGRAVGAKLLTSIFIPNGMGLVFIDDSGNYWQLRLAQNSDGSTFIGPDSRPTLELIQVSV